MSIQHVLTRRVIANLSLMLLFAAVGWSADPPSAVGSMLTLLKSGRVPEARLGAIVKLICDRGNEHDLRFVYDQILEEQNWPRELQASALKQLLDAARTRNVQPAGDLSELTSLFASTDDGLKQIVIELAGQWKVAAAFEPLQNLVQTSGVRPTTQSAALLAMAKISSEKTESVLEGIAKSDASFQDRSAAIHVLSTIRIEKSAALAASALLNASERDNPAVILDGFLDQDHGSKILAEAIGQVELAPDMAKLALRHMYSIGRADPELSAILSKIAGIAGDPQLPTPEELAALVQEVNAQGNAVRGEKVFRRADLSCMKCHAVSKAGGQIGPDLSALGASSPVEYVVMSVLDPDQAIKEAYTTRVVITEQGRVYQGLVADRTAHALVLKDATGKETSIPIDDIDEEVEGKSLMPKGLVKFMTHAEFIDLAKFLTTLGKPGEYAVRSTQRMQRWKLLKDAPDELVREVPSLSSFEDLVLRSNLWESVYAQVDGQLPLAELTEKTLQSVVYIQGELNVTLPGLVAGQLDSADGINIWLNEELLGIAAQFQKELPVGIHSLTLRVDTERRAASSVRLEFSRLSGSKAEFSVVDGQ